MVLATFTSPEYAYLARSYLADRGVESFIADEYVCQWFWHLTNALEQVKLSVREEDFADAQALLREAAYVETDGEYELISMPKHRYLILLFFFLTGAGAMALFFGREIVRVKRRGADSPHSNRTDE